MDVIFERLNAIKDAINTSKCTAALGQTFDGHYLDVVTSDPKFCPFHLEVTPFVFDIAAGNGFSESDVAHDDFYFYDVALSIVGGRAHLRKKSALAALMRPTLEIELTGNGRFYMSYGSALPVFGSQKVLYQSYLA